MKSLVDDYERGQDVLSEARDRITKGFNDLKENQYVFAAMNWMIDVDVSEILDINLGGVNVRNHGHPNPGQGKNPGGSLQ